MNNKETRRLIKAISLKNLAGNWLGAFLIFIIGTLAISLILGIIPFRNPSQEQILATVAGGGSYMETMRLFLPAELTKKTIAAIGVVVALSFFVTSAMNIGKSRFFLRVAAGQKGEMTDFFSAFADLRLVFASVGLEICILLLTFCWTVVFCIPSIAVMVVAIMSGLSALFAISYIALFVSAFYATLWCSRYQFARLILAEGKLGIFAALGEVRRLCKERNGELVALRASYLGWDLASLLFAPIAYVYDTLFSAVYARYLYHIRGDIEFISREEMEKRMQEAAASEAEKNGDAE